MIMARDRKGKVEFQSKLSMTGKNFKAGSLEESFPRATLLRKRVNQYFESCDMKKEHYSVPGLGLFLGLRTKVIINFNNEDDYEKREDDLENDPALSAFFFIFIVIVYEIIL